METEHDAFWDTRVLGRGGREGPEGAGSCAEDSEWRPKRLFSPAFKTGRRSDSSFTWFRKVALAPGERMVMG